MVIFRSLFFFIFFLNCTSTFALSSQETLSSQKRLYKTAQWDQFFAQAIYYRLKIDESHSFKNEVYDHIVALEILALSRHCQWAPIQQLFESAPIKSNLNVLSRIKKALSYIQLKKNYKNFLRDSVNSKTTIVNKIKRSRNLWPAKLKDFSKFSSPEKLRVKVPSLCQ